MLILCVFLYNISSSFLFFALPARYYYRGPRAHKKVIQTFYWVISPTLVPYHLWLLPPSNWPELKPLALIALARLKFRMLSMFDGKICLPERRIKPFFSPSDPKRFIGGLRQVVERRREKNVFHLLIRGALIHVMILFGPIINCRFFSSALLLFFFGWPICETIRAVVFHRDCWSKMAY